LRSLNIFTTTQTGIESLDWRFVYESVTESADYGLITQPVTVTEDYALII